MDDVREQGLWSMTEPLVCCVMLTADRPEMAARAVRAFDAQTYSRRELIVYDTGQKASCMWDFQLGSGKRQVRMIQSSNIAHLRNSANFIAPDHALICHWDDDDVSHPKRLEHQVEFHLRSGAALTGYSDLLFWDEPAQEIWKYYWRPNFALGTSLMYSKATWQEHKFDERKPKGSDTELVLRMPKGYCDPAYARSDLKHWCSAQSSIVANEPMLLGTIHSGNTNEGYTRNRKPNVKVWRKVDGEELERFQGPVDRLTLL